MGCQIEDPLLDKRWRVEETGKSLFKKLPSFWWFWKIKQHSSKSNRRSKSSREEGTLAWKIKMAELMKEAKNMEER